MQRQVFHKTLRLACTFNIESLRHKCPKDHEHEIVPRLCKRGPIQGQQAVRYFRAMSFATMRCMGIPCKTDSDGVAVGFGTTHDGRGIVSAETSGICVVQRHSEENC